MSVLFVKIKVRLSWNNHELGADNGNGTVHTWPGVWLLAFVVDFALDGSL